MGAKGGPVTALIGGGIGLVAGGLIAAGFMKVVEHNVMAE